MKYKFVKKHNKSKLSVALCLLLFLSVFHPVTVYSQASYSYAPRPSSDRESFLFAAARQISVRRIEKGLPDIPFEKWVMDLTKDKEWDMALTAKGTRTHWSVGNCEKSKTDKQFICVSVHVEISDGCSFSISINMGPSQEDPKNKYAEIKPIFMESYVFYRDRNIIKQPNGAPYRDITERPKSLAALKQAIAKILLAETTVNKADGGFAQLCGAIRVGNFGLFKKLVANGADINRKEGYVLQQAVFHGREDIVRLLVSKGADINYMTLERSTLIHFAGNAAVARYLVSLGLDVNSRNGRQDTPLNCAAIRGKTEVCDFLLSKGADVNSKGDEGRTPLHNAVLAIESELCQLLVSKGADIEAKDKRGRTPLFIAAEHGYVACCRLLVSRGADVNAESLCGERVLTVTKKRYDNKDVINLLHSKGARE